MFYKFKRGSGGKDIEFDYIPQYDLNIFITGNSHRSVNLQVESDRLLRYRIPQVVKFELPSATNWRAFIYFCNRSFVNVHGNDNKNISSQANFRHTGSYTWHYKVWENRDFSIFFSLECNWKFAVIFLMNPYGNLHHNMQ